MLFHEIVINMITILPQLHSSTQNRGHKENPESHMEAFLHLDQISL